MNNSSLSKSVAWYGFGNLFIRSLSFILLPLYSNLISTEEFGDFALLMSVYAIGVVLYQFGMQSALNKFFIEEKSEDKKKLIFSSVFNSILLLGIIFTIILWFTAPQFSLLIFDSTKFSYLLILIVITILIETLTFFILFLLKTKELAKRAVTYTIIGGITNLFLNIILVYQYRLGVPGIILSQLVAGAILLFLLINVIREDYIPKIDGEIFKAIFKFSSPLLLANLLTAGVNVADRFILNNLMGRDEVGIYSFSYRIAIVMNVFVASFSTAWNPHSLNLFYSNDYKQAFGKTLTKLIALSCVLLLIVSLFARHLFDLYLFNIAIFNPAYKAGVVIIPLVMIGYIFSGISTFYTVYPYVSNKTFHFLISDAIAFSTNIILNFILIPRIGLLGAAFATAIGFLCGAAYLFFISRAEIKIEYQTRDLLIIIIVALGILFIGLNIKNLFVDIFLILVYLVTLHYFAKIKINQIFKFS
ncbi:MAG: oligosaccharide flippase family protein [Candidatus Lokiarchaeota archaeon]|nr:oligosaccharide flippase family protein [Candidatus Lokiarchaeota archaeon]